MTTMRTDVKLQITAEPLTQAAFETFGDVVQNPSPTVHPSQYSQQTSLLPANAFSANQGFAIQYRNVSRINNYYSQSPSQQAHPAMSIFSCASRQISPQFNVKFLERHPFTTQTFTPIASSAETYLVVVAPTLAPSANDSEYPVPKEVSRGLPDLKNLKAFVADKNQAVTYAAGTWHAPMVVLGKIGTSLDFVVTQFMSGVGLEDCQLLEFEQQDGSDPELHVFIPRNSRHENL